MCLRQVLLLLFALLPAWGCAAEYEVRYSAEVFPEQGIARVEIQLKGERLPSRLAIHLNPERHRNFESAASLARIDDEVIWQPSPPRASLRYDFVIDAQRSDGGYDSRVTPDWAVLRSDKLVPSISVTAPKSLRSRALLDLSLPRGWSAAAPYEKNPDRPLSYRLIDPGRKFVRPKGWLILGDVHSRMDDIAGIEVRVAAPGGEPARLQDTLAFLAWTLPDIVSLFPDFQERLLVVMAGDPMWRGGLSGTRSLFMHANRPLISGNRTSSLIHELVHLATGIRGDGNSDWIVEGIAEYYAIEMLHRSGGISDTRFQETIAEVTAWGEEAPSLLVKRSSGSITARAVGVMHRLDKEIRTASAGAASLDTVAGQLARERGEVTNDRFFTLVDEAAGRKLNLKCELLGISPERCE